MNKNLNHVLAHITRETHLYSKTYAHIRTCKNVCYIYIYIRVCVLVEKVDEPKKWIDNEVCCHILFPCFMIALSLPPPISLFLHIYICVCVRVCVMWRLRDLSSFNMKTTSQYKYYRYDWLLFLNWIYKLNIYICSIFFKHTWLNWTSTSYPTILSWIR